MNDDVLTTPVHPILHKDTLTEQLGKGVRGLGTTAQYKRPPLPKEPEEASRTARSLLPKPSGRAVRSSKQLRLRVLQDRVQGPTGDLEPPCGSCKTKPCCTNFLVTISQEEYESGLYEHATKVTMADLKLLSTSKLLLYTTLPLASKVAKSRETRYYLGGAPGEPCPHLEDDGACGIYNHRPTVCRTYTCIGDARITDADRQGN